MLAAARHRGPDGVREFLHGPIALGHLALHSTPESQLDRQPLQSGALSLTMDGRLDNRDDLIQQLGLNQAEPISDVRLALLAYEKWGERFASRLVGYFALALWNS